MTSGTALRCTAAAPADWFPPFRVLRRSWRGSVQLSLVFHRTLSNGRSQRKRRRPPRGNRVGGKNLAAAGGNDENVLGPQADVFRLSGKYLLDVHGDLLVFLFSRDTANDPRLLRLGCASQSARQGQRAEHGKALAPAEGERAGMLHVADDVDHVGVCLGDGDHVVGLDLDIGGRVLSVQNLLHVQLSGAELSGGVDRGAGQRDVAVFAAARDGEAGARGLAQARRPSRGLRRASCGRGVESLPAW